MNENVILGLSVLYTYYSISLECPFHSLPVSFSAIQTPPKYTQFPSIHLIILPACFEIQLI